MIVIKVLELFAGTRCISKAFEKRGHKTFSVEWDKDFDNIDLYKDIGELSADEITDLFGRPDVMWLSPDCFPAGNLVWTSCGYKPIEEVECKDYVLTHNGNYKKVIKTIKKNDRKFVNIKISGCELFQSTLNHPFYVRKKVSQTKSVKGKSVRYSQMLEPEWKRADELTTEYRVGIPINNESIIPQWDGVVKESHNLYGKTLSWVENTLGEYMGNKDFWWLVGRYFGDGYLSKEKYSVDLCCAYSEIDEIREVVNRLGIKYTTRKKKYTFSFLFSSKEFCCFLEQFGSGSMGKKITPTILNLPIELLKSFLDGYISADGHWDNSKKNPHCSITTVSRILAYGIQQCLLKAYERYASMTINEHPNDVIQGRKVHAHTAYILGFYKNRTNRLQYKIENNMAWVNIRGIKVKNDNQKSIYTLSVEDDESFTVNNIAVHNCTSYSVAAISKHRKKNPETGSLDPISDYAKFCDKVNQHCLSLIKELNPKYYFIENPRGGLRKMEWMQELPRYTVTYCQYGDQRMKPTDIWTNHPNPNFKPPCHNGDPCHERAPRGARTGTQGLGCAREKAKIPDELCEHIVDICEEEI